MKKHVKESLLQNEQVVKEAKFSIIQLVPGIVIFIFMLMVSFVSDSIGEAFQFILTGLIIALIISIPGIKTLLACSLAITTHKICGKVGIIKTVEMNSPIHQVQNVKVSNGLLGKIFRYGTVNITTTSGVYDFKYVKNPKDFKNELMAQISRTEESKMDTNAQKIADAIRKS